MPAKLTPILLLSALLAGCSAERLVPREGTILDELMPRPVRVVAAAETPVAAVVARGNVPVFRGKVPGAPAATADEAYILEIGRDGAKITSAGQFGEIWARTTLDQLVRLSRARS